MHFAEIVGQLIELLDAVSKSDGQFFYRRDLAHEQRRVTQQTSKELGSPQEGSLAWVLTKEDHLLKRHASLGEGSKVMDLVP